jgi:DNA polymerase III alpha subunit
MTDFAELAALSNFTFLDGASHPQELVAQARALGHAAIGIADRNSFAGPGARDRRGGAGGHPLSSPARA